MAVTLKLAASRLEMVDQARRKKGWTKTSEDWRKPAETSVATLKRFWMGKPIKQDTFINLCQELGLNWEDVVDTGELESSRSSSTLDELGEQLSDKATRNIDGSLLEPKQLSEVDQLWQRLTAKAIVTRKMGLVLARPNLSTLGMRPRQAHPYLDIVPLNSDILFKINLDQKGYLILLEREPSGAVCCLCPSEYAPEFCFDAGEITLPQYPPSPYPTFTATELGQDQMVAVISPKKPPLDWLEISQQEALELNQNQIKALLEYIDRSSKAEVLYRKYSVI